MAGQKILKKESNVNETRHLKPPTEFFQQANSVISTTISTEICVANVFFSEYQVFGRFFDRKISNQTDKFSFDIVKNVENISATKNTWSVTISINSTISRHEKEVNIIC